MKHRFVCFISLVALITGCSHSQKSPEYEDYLATNIRSDGSKEFYYTLTMSGVNGEHRGGGRQRPTGGMRVSGGSSSNTKASGGISYSSGKGGRKGPQSGSHRSDELLSERLEKKLAATGYCREGWMEVERNFQPPNASIRGECDESATERDYSEFPNTEDV